MILDRLKEYIDYKNINISAFEKSIGMSNASFGKSLKNKGAIGTDKLENILLKYTDINPVWLLTGQGDMTWDPLLCLTSQKNNLPQNEPIIDLLKEQLKEKDQKIEMLSQEIGTLKAEISKLKEDVDKPLFKMENIDQSSLFNSPDATSARVHSKKTTKNK